MFLIYTTQGSGGLWLNSDANSTTFQSIKLSNTAALANDTYLLRGRLGATSGDIYTYGTYYNTTTYSFIARLNSSFSYVWYKFYTPQGSFKTFDVSPTEDFFYFFESSFGSTDNPRLYKGDALTGEIVFSFNLTLFKTDDSANIDITPSNDALYMNTDSLGSNTTHKLLIMR